MPATIHWTPSIWRPTIGGDRSSCVFALPETTVYLEDEARV